jgi:hypothetical protein
MDKLFEVLSQAFSPFKLLLIGYLILIYTDKITVTDYRIHILFGIIFIIGEILHNDCLRIGLNNLGQRMFKSENVLNQPNDDTSTQSKSNSISNDESLILQANNADHTLSNIHFLMHSILIASITLLLTISNNTNQCYIILLAILGIIVSLISLAALVRSQAFKEFWEMRVNPNYRNEWKEYINLKYKNKICNKFVSVAHYSRRILIFIFIIVYTVLIIISIYK